MSVNLYVLNKAFPHSILTKGEELHKNAPKHPFGLIILIIRPNVNVYEENKARFCCKRNNKIQFLGVIDNDFKKQPLEFIVLNTLMSFLDININESIPTANVDRALALTNAYLLIKSTVGNRRYIRDFVLTPLLDILKSMAKEFNSDTLRKPQTDMSNFLNHHQLLANKSLTAQFPTSPLLSEDDIDKLSLALEFISQGFVNPKPTGVLDLIFKTMSYSI